MTFAWWHLAVALIPVLPNLWSVWHVWSHDFNGVMQTKIVWLLLSVFLPCIGGLAYLFIGRKQAGASLLKKA